MVVRSRLADLVTTVARIGGVSASRRMLVGLIVAGVAVSAAHSLRAQDLYNSIVGVVKDAQGGVLPGAAVVIVNRDTGLKRETATNADGGYPFTNLQLLQTDKADVRSEIRSAEITNLPLNQYRNYQALINLVPDRFPAACQTLRRSCEVHPIVVRRR